MKKGVKIIVCILAVVVFMWAGMLTTDTVRSQNFQEPVFAKEIRAEADNDAIVYKGLGYTVKRVFFENQNGEPACVNSEVYLFGRVFSAVIT